MVNSALNWLNISSNKSSSTVSLCGCPQASGLVVSVCIMNPNKPNSAMRHVANLNLYRKPSITTRIPGSGYGVVKFNSAMASGGSANDLPGVSYSLISGVYDFPPLFGNKNSRSFYGLSRPSGSFTHISSKLSNKKINTSS